MNSIASGTRGRLAACEEPHAQLLSEVSNIEEPPRALVRGHLLRGFQDRLRSI